MNTYERIKQVTGCTDNDMELIRSHMRTFDDDEEDRQFLPVWRVYKTMSAKDKEAIVTDDDGDACMINIRRVA